MLASMGEPMANDEVVFAVLDVETTGFAARTDRIVEIAVIRLGADGRRLGEYATLLDPGRDVGPTHVHGITATDVLAAPRFGDVLGDLADMLRGAIVVGHNVQFDLGFLRAEAERAGHALPALASLCTLALGRRFAGDLPRRRLRDCCEDAGIDLVDAHSALGDASATAELLLTYLARARGVGITSLGELGCEAPAPAAAWPAWAPCGRAARRTTTVAPAEDGVMHRLLRRLAMAPDVDAGVTAYLEVLERALEDRKVTDAEAETLYEVARIWNLGPEVVLRAHRRYLRALVDAALTDGRISAEEEHDLRQVTRLLGMPPAALDQVCDEARASAAAAMDRVGAPAAHDLAGKRVCFTGALAGTLNGARITRSIAEALARRAGLRVCDAVDRDLELLVVADPNTQSTKAKKARGYGTRIMAEHELWRTLGLPVV